MLIRAAVSPTAAVATAVGAGIGVLDHSYVVAVILGAAGWTVRMMAALVADRRRNKAALPRPAAVDPWSVPEPWRQLLTQAAEAQLRFRSALAGWPPGPTRDRLCSLEPRVYAEVGQLAELARRGAEAEGWTGATFSSGRPSNQGLAEELAEVQSRRRQPHLAGTERAHELDRREAAIAAQLRANRKASAAGAELQDRLRVAVARLDESVTELLALEAAGSGSPVLSSALDELTDGISSLHAALAGPTDPPIEPETP